jgi:transcriptional regulator with XRE-family HTH domain
METPCLECVFVLREQGGMSLRRIASALGVCYQTVCRILSGKKWKHLELAVRS